MPACLKGNETHLSLFPLPPDTVRDDVDPPLHHTNIQYKVVLRRWRGSGYLETGIKNDWLWRPGCRAAQLDPSKTASMPALS